MSGIQSDLKDGNKFEDYILDIVKKDYPDAVRMEGYFPDYDIEVPGKDITYECKFDRMSQKTGNLAIEFEYNKKPSGINKSKAVWWVYGYFNKKNSKWMHAFIKTEDLKKQCDGYRVVNGGDRWASKMYLIPVEDFEKFEGIEILEA